MKSRAGNRVNAAINLAILLATAAVLVAVASTYFRPDPLRSALERSRAAAETLRGRRPRPFAVISHGDTTTVGGQRRRPLAVLIGATGCPQCKPLRTTWDSLSRVDTRIDYVILHPGERAPTSATESAGIAASLGWFQDGREQDAFNVYYNATFKVIPAILLFDASGSVIWTHVGELGRPGSFHQARARLAISGD